MSRCSRLRWILWACPLLIVLAVFLGPEFSTPWRLFESTSLPVLEARLWRVALGAFVGAALAMAGVVLQAILRNPLAEPYVLGVSAGASLGMALCLYACATPSLAPFAGFLGGLLSLFVVFRLAAVRRITAPHTLILAGVVWASLCGSLLMFVVSTAQHERLRAVLWWVLGDLQPLSVDHVKWISAVVLGSAALLWVWARDLDVLLLGEEVAGQTGIHLERTKFFFLAAATLLTASTVSVCGMIGFVGLTVPHVARALVGPAHRRLILAAAVLGAAFLAVADGVGRALLYPIEVPAGVITSLIGAPFFLVLLKKARGEMWP